MKKIFVVLATLAPVALWGAEPSTSCPSGYKSVEEKNLHLDTDSCPSGYIKVNAVTSCLVGAPAAVCMMYVPTNTTYSDTSGEYVYTDICPLE